MSIHKNSNSSAICCKQKKSIEWKIWEQEEEFQCFGIEGNNNIAQTHHRDQQVTHTNIRIICYSIFLFIFNFFLMIQYKMEFLRLSWLKPILSALILIKRWR